MGSSNESLSDPDLTPTLPHNSVPPTPSSSSDPVTVPASLAPLSGAGEDEANGPEESHSAWKEVWRGPATMLGGRSWPANVPQTKTSPFEVSAAVKPAEAVTRVMPVTCSTRPGRVQPEIPRGPSCPYVARSDRTAWHFRVDGATAHGGSAGFEKERRQQGAWSHAKRHSRSP